MSISDAAWQASHLPPEYPACPRIDFPPTLPRYEYAAKVVRGGVVLLFAPAVAFGNGGAWQTGVPLTGNGAASDQKKSTNVTIEDENLTIDLHQEFAAVEVRYRMKNTRGPSRISFSRCNNGPNPREKMAEARKPESQDPEKSFATAGAAFSRWWVQGLSKKR